MAKIIENSLFWSNFSKISIFDLNVDFVISFFLSRFWSHFSKNSILATIFENLYFERKTTTKISILVKKFEIFFHKISIFAQVSQQKPLDLAKFWPNTRFIENFDKNRDFSKLWTKIEIYETFDQKEDFF